MVGPTARKRSPVIGIDAVAEIDPASFRDRSGFVFRRQGRLYRQINESYKPHYDHFLSSGLYDELVTDGLLVEHHEVSALPAGPQGYKIIEPRRVPLISYPYEWCFSQLKDAALLTLELQRRALRRGMTLKDASAYNVQFEDAAPVFIDTLSFESYVEGRPWVAYRQFCQHFLAPLALMAYVDVRLGPLSRLHLDGVPLELASRLLPWSTWCRGGLFVHIHLHARQQQRHAGNLAARGRISHVSRAGLDGIVENLASTIQHLCWRPGGTEWSNYYEDNNNYTDRATRSKSDFLADCLVLTRPATVLDLGANTGRFSHVASEHGARVVSLDVDPSATERLYLHLRATNGRGVQPLNVDLTNPAGGLGWAHQERPPLFGRIRADLVMALALVHHLALTNHVPFEAIAALLAELGPTLVIEFVPAHDSQAQNLLAGRESTFRDYNEESFARAFSRHFDVTGTRAVDDSLRRLYLMRRKAILD